MMNDLVVRRASAGDLSAVFQLDRAVAEAPHWPEAEYAVILDQFCADKSVSRCFFVAVLEKTIVGFAIGKAIGTGPSGLAELESVAVDSAARRRGGGAALCRAVIDWSRERGVRELQLEVRAGSDGPIALYRRLGFVEFGRRKAYYRERGEDALLMRLELAEG